MSFEVQTYKNNNWDIITVLEDKNSAIAEAHRLLESKIHISVRVVEEIFDEASDSYRSKVVFRRERQKRGSKEEEKAERAKAAKQKREEEESEEDEDKKGAAAAAPRKKVSLEKIFIRGLLTILLIAGGGASYWQSQQPDPEPETEKSPAKLVKREKGAPAAVSTSPEEEFNFGVEGGGEWKSVSGAAQKGFTKKRKSAETGESKASGASEADPSGHGEEGPSAISFGSVPTEDWSSVSGAVQKGFTKKRKSAETGESGASEADSSGPGEEGPPAISFGSVPTEEWSSISKTAQKGFARQREGSESGDGAGSGAGDGSQEEEIAALPPSGPPIFFPLPVFEYSDVRNRKLERAVVLQVTLDVIGDEGLDRVKEKADDLYAALDKDLARIISKAEKDKDSFTVPFLKERFLAICVRELGEGVVREVLIQDAKEARATR